MATHNKSQVILSTMLLLIAHLRFLSTFADMTGLRHQTRGLKMSLTLAMVDSVAYWIERLTCSRQYSLSFIISIIVNVYNMCDKCGCNWEIFNVSRCLSCLWHNSILKIFTLNWPLKKHTLLIISQVNCYTLKQLLNFYKQQCDLFKRNWSKHKETKIHPL